MRAFTKIQMAYALLALGTVAAVQGQIPWATEPFERTGKAEVYGIGQFLHQDEVTYKGPQGDVKMKLNDTGLGGFGMAYHFNDFISLRGDFMFGGADLRTSGAGGTPLTLADDALIHTGRLNVDWNIINRRLTPFLTAGIGYQYLEAELSKHPDVAYCYWDPWYDGYYCEVSKPYHTETDFTWNVGAGVRWNVTDQLFIKATGGAQWLEYEDADEITMQIEGFFAIGWMF